MRIASRRLLSVSCIVLGLVIGSSAGAQQMQQRERQFMRSSPLVGDPLPSLTVYAPDGSEFKTDNLRGHYTVLTFGCLT